MQRSRACSLASVSSRRAYSRAAAGSWIEQGPTMTTSRSSSPRRMRAISRRVRVTVCEPRSLSGCSSSSSSGRKLSMRRSRVRSDIGRKCTRDRAAFSTPPARGGHDGWGAACYASAAVDRLAVLERIQKRVLWLGTYMVHHANSLRASADGIKVGGHQASSSSVVSLLTALYFDALRGDDLVAVKAHGSPAFYAIQYLRGRLTADDLRELRSFGGLQAYPSHRKNAAVVDLSTGSMGLGAVQATFGALASRYVADHFTGRSGGRVIVIVGDAELDEGNVAEALAEEVVARLSNVLWIVDVNRQSLDRIVPDGRLRQMRAMFEAGGWRVSELRWGRKLQSFFGKRGGERLRERLQIMPNTEY